MKRLCIVSAALGLFAIGAWAEDMRIVVPYVGTYSETREVEDVGELDETGLFTGLYFQWINPESYQWNAFVYYVPDVNYASTLGGHFIFDKYFGRSPSGKFLVGGGIEALTVSMDAGSELGNPPVTIDDFTMSMTLLIPYVRFGKYFTAKAGPADFSALPWVGAQPQWVRGDLETEGSMSFPPFAFSEKVSLDDSALYAIAGLNLKVTLYRFIDLEAKYQAAFDVEDYFNAWSGLANVYLNRSWGLSYRLKFMESGQSDSFQHYVGAAYVF